MYVWMKILQTNERRCYNGSLKHYFIFTYVEYQPKSEKKKGNIVTSCYISMGAKVEHSSGLISGQVTLCHISGSPH